MAKFVANARLEADITVAWLVRDIVKGAFAAIDFETPAKHWSFKFDKVDGRKKNGGRSKRQARSWHFKKNIILEHEKMQNLYPDAKEQASTLVAMVFNIDRNQVNDWRRSRDKIFKNAKGKCKNNTKAYKLRLGRFPSCEKAVYDDFVKCREKGKQVGPKWLRVRMRREVAAQKPTGWRLFTSSAGWLWRFKKGGGS